MPFGDELTEEQRRQLMMEQAYKGFLSGQMGQMGGPGRPFQMGAQPPEQPQQTPEATPLLQIQPQIQPQMQAAPLEQPKPQPTSQPDFAGLLADQEKGQKNKWMLPVGLGLLNLSAALATPYRKGIDAPPWATGIQGMGQGIVQGMALQKAQQDELYKKIKAMAELKKVYNEPKETTIGGVRFARLGEKLIRLDDKAGSTKVTSTEAERYAKENMVSLDKAYEILEAARTRGRVSETPEKPEKSGEKSYKPEIWYDPKNPDDRISYRPGIDPNPPGRYYPMGTGPMPGLAQASVPDDSGMKAHLREYFLRGKDGLVARGITGGPVLKQITDISGKIPASEWGDLQPKYAALAGGMKRLENQRTLIEAFTNNAQLNMTLANKISEGVNRLGSPAAQKWVGWWRRNINGEVGETADKDINAFHAIVKPLTDEIARITSSATGGSVSSLEGQKMYAEILSDALNKGQFKNVSAILSQELDNRGAGYKKEEELVDAKMQKLLNRADELTEKAFSGSGGSVGSMQTKPQLNKITGPSQLPINKGMTLPNGKVVARLSDGNLYELDPQTKKPIGRWSGSE